jgi:hypothetical protein
MAYALVDHDYAINECMWQVRARARVSIRARV